MDGSLRKRYSENIDVDVDPVEEDVEYIEERDGEEEVEDKPVQLLIIIKFVHIITNYYR